VSAAARSKFAPSIGLAFGPPSAGHQRLFAKEKFRAQNCTLGRRF
jgi:hypothetical protein